MSTQPFDIRPAANDDARRGQDSWSLPVDRTGAFVNVEHTWRDSQPGPQGIRIPALAGFLKSERGEKINSGGIPANDP